MISLHFTLQCITPLSRRGFFLFYILNEHEQTNVVRSDSGEQVSDRSYKINVQITITC